MKKKAFAILTLCMSLLPPVALVGLRVAAAALPAVAMAAEQKSQPWI